MKKIHVVFTAVVALLFVMSACNQKVNSHLTGSKKITLDNEIDSVSYALGVNGGAQMRNMGITELNQDVFTKSFADAMGGEECLISPEESGQILDTYFRKMYEKQMTSQQEGAENNLKEGINFLEKNKSKKGVIVTPSGLQYIVMKMGDGPKPKATDNVKVHYHGTTIDGTVFDSSVDRGEPVEFPLNGVISGWTEGVQLMPVGSKFKFFIPQELAYGTNPPAGSGIGSKSVLIFEVELLEFN